MVLFLQEYASHTCASRWSGNRLRRRLASSTKPELRCTSQILILPDFPVQKLRNDERSPSSRFNHCKLTARIPACAISQRALAFVYGCYSGPLAATGGAVEHQTFSTIPLSRHSTVDPRPGADIGTGRSNRRKLRILIRDKGGVIASPTADPCVARWHLRRAAAKRRCLAAGSKIIARAAEGPVWILALVLQNTELGRYSARLVGNARERKRNDSLKGVRTLS